MERGENGKGTGYFLNYDTLSRKTSMNDPDMGYWQYTYDANGNLVSQKDANGNMTTRAGVNISYNYDNKPTSIGSTTFVYDYSGQRVKKNSTVYIGKLYECTGGSCNKYIFAGHNRIALVTSSNATYYYHTDHLGSSSVMTDQNGAKYGEFYYHPYGKRWYTSGGSNIRHKFTGQELDDETGLYYYGARYYDPAIGRFVSADSIVQDYTDPQTLNRYSYCRNNPLIYVDPSGHLFIIDDIIIAAATYIAANAAVIAEGAAIGAAIGGAQAAVTGGNIGMGMLTGAVSGALFAGVAHPITAPLIKAGDWGAVAMVHGATGALSGGINTAITGGNLSSNILTGAMTSAFGTASGGVFYKLDFGYQLAGRSVMGGLMGGAIAESQGGDFGSGFARGAASAATAYLCNELRDDLKEMAKALKFSACGVKEISEYTFKWVGKHALFNIAPITAEYLGIHISLSVDAAYTATKLINVADHALNHTQEEIMDLGNRIEDCKGWAGIK